MQTTEKTETYPQYKTLDFSAIEAQVAHFWDEQQIFHKSVALREGKPTFTFYEGPPSANGAPGIHHVMARTLKDLVCRYQTLKGFQVNRKGGWDTHGLPIELQVEKTLGITKKDIGEKISIADYNKACRQDVMKFKHLWDDITVKMGYWLDLDDPYITFENDYIESVWHLLKKLYDKGLIYKGYTIQPYSPAAGTGLSTHELNMPGCYRPVKDTSAVAQFKIKGTEDEFFLAWTTTPWTLPANSALAVGKEIVYVKVDTYNPYTHIRGKVILAKERLSAYFTPEGAELPMEDYKTGDKKIPYRIISEHKGKELEGIKYEQLLPYIQPDESKGEAFRVIVGDFVSTEDGTGIVHIAPTFGSDDLRVARLNNIPPIAVYGNDGEELPIVDRQGKFVAQITDFAGRYVKDYTNDPNYQSVDVDIAIKLKTENKAFKVEKYEHNYPHCWRTDKPVLYYPLDSWFIASSKYRERMVELNKTINWKPESTGSGRFGNWLENLTDWNLSRSRYWGIPLPLWVNEDKTETKCIGSIQELSDEIELAVKAGLMIENPVKKEGFDLHRPYCDEIILADSQGRPMLREPDLIDVWFDSGSMPYAQWHYPFENEETFKNAFPADFIAEGVDQTRGWFFTLHAIAVMLFDSVAFKNVIANGLVLDKDGNKMSKRLGNAIDPFATIAKYGADPTRWYMIENAPPWDNLKFNLDGITETQRRFFGTLYNTYSFFALYANIDGFVLDEKNIVPVGERPELDRWIISRLHSLVKQADAEYGSFEPTRAARFIQEFVVEDLSNWYVRLARRRFWKGELTEDKKSAYETLFECLTVVAQLMSPIAPYFSDWLYKNLTDGLRGNLGLGEGRGADYTQLPENLLVKARELRQKMTDAEEHLWEILRNREFEGYKFRRQHPVVVGNEQYILDFYCAEKKLGIELDGSHHFENENVEYDQKRTEALNHLGISIIRFSNEPIFNDLEGCLELIKNRLTSDIPHPLTPSPKGRRGTPHDELPLPLGEGRGEGYRFAPVSVHLTDFTKSEEAVIDLELEERMTIAQQICSLVRSIRRKVNIKVRQPLSRLMIPALDPKVKERVEAVADLIKSEINVKELEFVTEDNGILVKKIKPNFKNLGKRAGKNMPLLTKAVAEMSQDDIRTIEKAGVFKFDLSGEPFDLPLEDAEITTEDLPGWSVASEGKLTVALDITLTEELRYEGIAREFVNRIQNLRKDLDFDVTDHITLTIEDHPDFGPALRAFQSYICAETLADAFSIVPTLSEAVAVDIDGTEGKMRVEKR